MGFRENLIQKLQIDRLADQVRQSLKPSDPPRRIDRPAMQTLLEMGAYRHRQERDLDLYVRDKDGGGRLILVLDNELKLYDTSIDDVVLRKSPTVKEMVNIRNAIKILNDKDVVVSRKTETLQNLQADLVDRLDLTYTAADIEALATDGGQALQRGYADGMVEILSLFAELLGFEAAPKALQLPHHHVWGDLIKREGVDIQMNPVVLLNLMHLTLKMIRRPVGSLDKASLDHLQKVGKSETKADIEGPEVFAALKDRVITEKPVVKKTV